MTNAEKYKTAEERARAFSLYCNDQDISRCPDDRRFTCVHRCIECFIRWLDLDAEEAKPLPCPFCGNEVETAETLIGKKGFSCSCGYTSKAEFGWDAAVDAHNRVARAMMKSGKKEVKP